MLVDDGIILLKYWFSVSDEEQEKREAYSRAKDDMFAVTDLPEAPWWTVESDNKKAARLNVIHHLLSQIPYKTVKWKKVTLPDRPSADDYDRPPRELYKYVPDFAGELPQKEAGRGG
jgi:hypothetical protein